MLPMTPSIPSRFICGLAVALFVLVPVSTAHADEGGSWFGRLLGLNSVTGSGKVQTETRALTGFHGVSVKGSMKVVLRQGSREGVEVSADSNLLPLIETRIRNGTLEIGTVKNANYSTRNPVLVTVDLITLKNLAISGSGDVTAKGVKVSILDVAIGGSGSAHLPDLQARSLSLSIGGSGDVDTSGRTHRFSISVGGSGSVRADALEADDVSVAIGGSGDASVKANRTLDVSVAGSGDVVYSGDAVVKSSIAGSGTVKKR
jgi:hypothetical protein